MIEDKLIKYHYYSFVLLIFAISIQGIIPALPNILVGAQIAVVILILGYRIALRHRFLKPVLITYLILLIYLILKSSINDSFMQELPMISRYAIPLVFLLSAYFLPKSFLQWLLKAFILGTMLSLIISCFNLYSFYQNNEALLLSTGKHIDEVIIGGRVYLSYSVVFSAIFCLYLLNQESKLYNWLYLLCFVIQYVFILIISARLAIGLLTILVFFYIYKHLDRKKFVISIVGIIALIGIMFTINPNLGNRFLYLDKNKEVIQNFKQWEPRWVIWQCNRYLIEDADYSILWGFENSLQVEEKLVDCYGEIITDNDSKLTYFERERFNSHNQYFDFLLYGGVVLLALFLMIIVQLVIGTHLNSMGCFILFALLSMFLVENLFHRQQGAYLIGVVLSFIALNQKTSLKET